MLFIKSFKKIRQHSFEDIVLALISLTTFVHFYGDKSTYQIGTVFILILAACIITGIFKYLFYEFSSLITYNRLWMNYLFKVLIQLQKNTKKSTEV
ncbi:hypothetical protein BpHYR1_004604 [Brachionus plicatilis]|uniref:Uncharacterized protein n=1 Tax=Brachionus plicatilis TaxID=10195 RepID=A0A3M7PB57_BRAPC|nr:hypothetical protein BpHYR1_004604 [Brachionus plicatilis]